MKTRRDNQLPYRWDKQNGIVYAETGYQFMQILKGHFTVKERERVGKRIVFLLNKYGLEDKE